MIQLPIVVRNEHKEKVKNFCSENNIQWGTVYSECWNEGVHGTPKECEEVEKYVQQLETERKEFRKNKNGRLHFKRIENE